MCDYCGCSQVIKQKLLTAPVSEKIKPVFDVIRYEDHESCQAKTGSSVKAKFSINAVEPVAPPQ